jgi:hypothetical protein
VQKLVIVGRVQDRLQQIKSELKPLLDVRTHSRVSVVRPGYLETALDHITQAVIADVDFLNKSVFPLVVQIRKLGFGGPIVVLGNPVDHFDLQELQVVRGLYHLHKPYQVQQLLGLVKNCLNVALLRKRRDQRFSVCEQATLHAYSSDLSIETTISNISRSGVRIEGSLGDLKQGDLLKMHFNFDQLQKERVMNARVVWIKKGSDEKEEAGLEFVSQKAIYQYLLDYAVA